LLSPATAKAMVACPKEVFVVPIKPECTLFIRKGMPALLVLPKKWVPGCTTLPCSRQSLDSVCEIFNSVVNAIQTESSQ